MKYFYLMILLWLYKETNLIFLWPCNIIIVGYVF